MSQVEFLLTVGKLDASLALLTTDDHHVIEFPTVLLPDNVKAGSIVKLAVSQTFEEERKQRELFREIQAKILEKYGTRRPSPPVLKVVNVTQTSCVLAWDPLQLGSASLKSLTLYRQGVRSTVIPCPLKTNTTKISGLSVDTDYEFELKLTTTSGQLWSQKVKTHTHKMTDMSGITVCLGPLDPLLGISGAQVAQSLSQIGARPMQRKVAIDTTHFVTNDIENDDDPELIKAKNSNIPIVRPEWVRASEMERRIVGVRGFYLDADQGILKSYQFPPATDEAKAIFAKLKAGETTENLNTNKELPKPKEPLHEAEESKQLEEDAEKEAGEDTQITAEDLREAAQPPVSRSHREDVVEDSQLSEKSTSKEINDSGTQEIQNATEEAKETQADVTQHSQEQEIAVADANEIVTAETHELQEDVSAEPADLPERPEAEPAIDTAEDTAEDTTEDKPAESAELREDAVEATEESANDFGDLAENRGTDGSAKAPEEPEKVVSPYVAAEGPAETAEEDLAEVPTTEGKDVLENKEASEEPPIAAETSTPSATTELPETTEVLAEADPGNPLEPAESLEQPEATPESVGADSHDSELNAEHVQVSEVADDGEEAAAKEPTATKKTTKKNKNKKKNKKKK